MRKSINPEIFNQKIIIVSGFWGSGKSTFAARWDWPEFVALADCDFGKSETAVKDLQGVTYSGKLNDSESLDKTAQNLIAFLDDLPPNVTTVIIDNIHEAENAIFAFAQKNPAFSAKLSNVSAKNIVSNAHGSTYPASEGVFKALVMGLFDRGVKTVVLCSHLKEKRDSLGQMQAKARSHWSETSVLNVLLIKSQSSDQLPIGIVTKEALSSQISDDINEEAAALGLVDTFEVRRCIPPRLYAHPGIDYKITGASPALIRWYLQNPADFDNLHEMELPTKEEMRPFADLMSETQIQYMMSLVDERKAVAAQAVLEANNAIISEINNRIREMKDGEGLQPPKILAKIKTEYPDSYAQKLTVPDILRVVQ